MKYFKFGFLFLFVLIGCFKPTQSLTEKKTFTFEYYPKETLPSGSSNMVLAMVKPYYRENFKSGNSELFKNFEFALGKDIEEIIIAKGFNLLGPYDSRDEMIYIDKKKSDIFIQIEIDPRFTAHEGGWKSSFSLSNSTRVLYKYSGKVSLIGKINISGIEPLTGQKIWAKSVSIPNVEDIPIETSKKYNHILNDLELINDPAVYNELGKALAKQYVGILDKITAHFNVQELTSMKSQINDLKSKKEF